jgi:hypothetical protein
MRTHKHPHEQLPRENVLSALSFRCGKAKDALAENKN